MKFGEVLQSLLEEYEWTPREVAEGLRIPITMMNSFLRCQQEPDIELLKRIAAYFDVSMDDLLDYRGVPRKSEHQMEGELLQAFSELPPEYQRAFLEQGRAAVRFLEREE